MKKSIIFLISILLITLVCCNSNLNKNRENQFSFLVLSDIHVSTNMGHEIRLNNFVEKFNSDSNLNSSIDFITTTGDNASYIYTSRYLNRDSIANNQLRKYVNTMSNLKVPVYSCMGNHEYKIDKKRDSDGYFPESEILEMEEIWKKETQLEPYYSIKKGDYNLVFLNSMRGRFQNSFFGTQQIEWLKKEVSESKNLILFFHHPMRTDNIDFWYKKIKGTMTKETEPEFYKLVLNNKDKLKGVFVGHGHKWMNDKLFGLIDVYETASFGDNEDFMYYKVDVSNGGIKVEKSINQPNFKGFKF